MSTGETLPLGTLWFREYYTQISDSLKLDGSRDREARSTLSDLLRRKSPSSPQIRLSQYENKQIVVFGAGPSLVHDIKGLLHVLKKEKQAIIAADGAADALVANSITPSIIVSDLDSCSEKTLTNVGGGTTIFVHAHGDNIDLMKRIVPLLKSNLVGTTQVEPVDNVQNYGGFTDGDRSCYIAASFNPKLVAIAGMDFGLDEGSYSKNRYDKSSDLERRERKLNWGRSSLEYLIRHRRDIRFCNLTKFGLEIEGARKLNYEEFISELSSHD